MSHVSFFAFVIAGALFGCEPQVAATSSDRCPAYEGALDHLVGELLDHVRDQIPAEDDQFATRVPGGFYTREYRRERTLAYLDADGRIERLSCG